MWIFISFKFILSGGSSGNSIFETESHIAQAGTEIAVSLKVTVNSRFSCSDLPGTGI